jgi:hypothetical protein
MKNLFIYHEGSGTFISLSDRVYLIDADIVSEEVLDDLEMGARVTPEFHKGYRLDNYNMTNIFFGGE